MATQAGIQGDISSGGLSLGILGDVGSVYEGFQKADYQSQSAQISGQITGFEQQINAQRQQQMILNSKRQSVENLRNVQKAQSLGKSAAANQGALFGSGYAGGQASDASKGAFNAENISQNLQIGENIFGLQNQISAAQIRESQLESSAASAGGLAGLFSGAAGIGGAIMKAAPELAALAAA